MRRLGVVFVLFMFAASLDAAEPRAKNRRRARAKPAAPAVVYDLTAVNNPAVAPPAAATKKGSAVLRAQILLDRANFSVGEINGALGPTTQHALSGFQRARNLSPSGTFDPETWAALNMDSAPALVPYRVTAEDVAGPFEKLPEDLMQRATVKALGYETPLEAISERFHVSPALLQELNKGKQITEENTEIFVPNVITNFVATAASIEVSKSEGTVSALDQEGKIIAQYPSSSGSEHDPLPLGTWKINGVARNPKFHYNPKLFWDADAGHSKAILPPGPNSPVGVVWIDLSKDHYGIHGTPEPAAVGLTQSHGCIRLTNWDAMELASLVKPGVAAILKD